MKGPDSVSAEGGNLFSDLILDDFSEGHLKYINDNVSQNHYHVHDPSAGRSDVQLE